MSIKISIKTGSYLFDYAGSICDKKKFQNLQVIAFSQIKSFSLVKNDYKINYCNKHKNNPTWNLNVYNPGRKTETPQNTKITAQITAKAVQQ